MNAHASSSFRACPGVSSARMASNQRGVFAAVLKSATVITPAASNVFSREPSLQAARKAGRDPASAALAAARATTVFVPSRYFMAILWRILTASGMPTGTPAARRTMSSTVGWILHFVMVALNSNSWVSVGSWASLKTSVSTVDAPLAWQLKKAASSGFTL